MVRVGLISDTHGLLRPEAVAFLRGCEHIIHAGDIGNDGVLDQLRGLAPLASVRGNNDRGDWAQRLAETEFLEIAGVYVYVIHDLQELDIDPGAAGVRVVVSGHSHRPRIEEKNGVLYVNPGSSGPRRFKLPVSVGELTVSGASVSARIVELDLGKPG